MQRGDILIEADGLSMTSNEGARRLFDAEPGETILVEYKRDGSLFKTRIKAAERPAAAQAMIERLRAELGDLSRHPGERDPQAMLDKAVEMLDRARQQRRGPEHLRYAGTFGDVDLEVRGLDSVHVTVDEGDGVVEIRTIDSTIRLTRETER